MMYQCVIYDGHGSVPSYHVLNIDPEFYGDTYEEIIGNPSFHQRVEECIKELYPTTSPGVDLPALKEYVFLILNDSIKKIIVGR